ncbi:Hypoxic response protein 1 [Luteitalea pratensis]|uniref:Hypoxic response protein 1 n=1 Tax=Luteitalea pratensis TaxID=1855912 RepID=A0A143PH49_LUTPR|nr:CBS domain-containing protein [Luteitalea pratensis]AMY07887.1 Hypoxic response protein 1 [Luteitalea pratensis]
MNIEELMTPNPACCTPETPVADVATMMMQHDCGEIPVVTKGGGLIGVVTDRDIVVRLVANGGDLRRATAANCMTQPAVSLPPDAQVSDAIELMQAHQVRRLPIVNGEGEVCGIVAQADLARWATAEQTGDLVRDVSEPQQAV